MDKLGEQLFVLFSQGGSVLWAILAASLLMWSMILERYSFYFIVAPRFLKKLQNQWLTCQSGLELPDQRLRNSLISEFDNALIEYIKPIRSLTDILLLLGLLGTINGMIKVFDVMSVFGTGSARAMAAGISQALITTMAGLVTALSGIYFALNLESLAKRKLQKFTALLMHCSQDEVSNAPKT